jgi:hypothetical protein
MKVIVNFLLILILEIILVFMNYCKLEKFMEEIKLQKILMILNHCLEIRHELACPFANHVQLKLIQCTLFDTYCVTFRAPDIIVYISIHLPSLPEFHIQMLIGENI